MEESAAQELRLLGGCQAGLLGFPGGDDFVLVAGVALLHLFPISVDGVPVVVLDAGNLYFLGPQHPLVGDEKELDEELNAHLAQKVDFVAHFGLGLANGVEEAHRPLEAELAKQANLHGQDSVVKADAAKGPDKGVELHLGEVVVGHLGAVHRGGELHVQGHAKGQLGRDGAQGRRRS